MKKILHLVLLSVMLVTATTAQAQFRRPTRVDNRHHNGGYYIENNRVSNNGYSNWHNDVYFGFKLGFNASSVRSDAPDLDGNKVQCGLNAGIAVGFYLSHYYPISLETGIYYTEKGGKSDGIDGRFTYDLNYLELPIVFKYKIITSRDVAIEPFLGGYAAVGVSGDIKDYNNREAFSSFDDGYFRRGDGGLRFGCGVSFQMVSIEASYDLGLANIGQDSFDKTHNGNFTLTAGVTF